MSVSSGQLAGPAAAVLGRTGNLPVPLGNLPSGAPPLANHANPASGIPQRVLALAMIALFGAACERNEGPLVAMAPPPGAEQPAELPKHWAVPDFSLIERGGRRYTRADLLGKVWVADFFYTTCPGPCPMMSSRLSALQEKLGNRADVRLVSISTDPAKDQPPVLQAYADRFKAGPSWLFFTGDKAEIFELANKGFKVSVTEERNNPEPITHSTKLVLVDREGYVRGFYEGVASDETARLLAHIDRLLAGSP